MNNRMNDGVSAIIMGLVVAAILAYLADGLGVWLAQYGWGW